MDFIATQKYIRVSPKKLRYVTFLLKKMTPSDAVQRLPFVGKRAAEPILKVIKTAIANAKQKGVLEKDLVFKEVQINEGPRLKRWRAASRGRAKPYVRAMSHIRVVVETRVTEKKQNSSGKEVKKIDSAVDSKKKAVTKVKEDKK